MVVVFDDQPPLVVDIGQLAVMKDKFISTIYKIMSF